MAKDNGKQNRRIKVVAAHRRWPGHPFLGVNLLKYVDRLFDDILRLIPSNIFSSLLQAYAFFIMAAAWGVADAVWQTQINGKSGQRTVELHRGSHSFRQADMTLQVYYNLTFISTLLCRQHRYLSSRGIAIKVFIYQKDLTSKSKYVCSGPRKMSLL